MHTILQFLPSLVLPIILFSIAFQVFAIVNLVKKDTNTNTKILWLIIILAIDLLVL